MVTQVRLVALPEDTSFAPLGVLGYCLSQSNFLQPVWEPVKLPLKTVEHSVPEKLQDILLSILAGCRCLSQSNTLLKPDLALAKAWRQEQFADQATLARTLDSFDDGQIAALRQGSEKLFCQYSRVFQHDYAQTWLFLDIDLTPLPISKHAEASTKGKFRQKNQFGRQLARVIAPQYNETLFSQVYPGKQDSGPTYPPVLKALEAFPFTTEQRQRTVLRSDAGFGSDSNVNLALDSHWQLLAKGKGGRRPQAYARQIAASDWIELAPQRWIAPAVAPPLYHQPTQHWVLRWTTPTGITKYSTMVCSLLSWTPTDIMDFYDSRGGAETEIRTDKQGLWLERRRKHCLHAQEALILLVDLAHNLLAWTRQWMFPVGPCADFAALRLTADVFRLPGRLIFQQNRLVEVQLNAHHPYADIVATGLERLLLHFGNP